MLKGDSRRGLVSSIFVLGRVLRHFCNVLLQNNENLKQNIAEDERRKNKIQNLSFKPDFALWLLSKGLFYIRFMSMFLTIKRNNQPAIYKTK